MKVRNPLFGLLSGCSTTIGLLPHIIALCFMTFFSEHPPPLIFLIVFTLGAKLLCEWVFWSGLFPKRMDLEKNLQNWRESVSNSLFIQPTVISSLLNIFVDFCVDVLLVYSALKTSVPPVWIFLGFFGSQAFAAPIQGIISDFLRPKKCLVFSLVATAFAVVLSLEIGKEITTRVTYASALGLYHFATSTQMLMVLYAKGLLTNTTVIARAAIAESIQTETERKFSKTSRKNI